MQRAFLLFCSAVVAASAALACSTTVTSSSTGGSPGTGGAVTTASGTSSSSGSVPDAGVVCTDPDAPAVFEIGGGQTCFERLTAGQEVPVIAGPQGGYHLWLGVGCADCAAQVILRYGIKDPATMTWWTGTAENLAVVSLDTAGWHQLAGIQDRLPGAPWDQTSLPPKGTHVLLSAAVLDDSMAVVHEAEVEVVLGDMQSWSPPCDLSSSCGQPGSLPCCTDGSFGGGGP